MSMQKYLPLLPATLGFLFCLPNIFGYEAFPCRTSGCRVYGDSVVTWILGALAFLAIFTASASDMLRGKILRPLCALALLADSFLLGLLILTGPCVQCMFVAAMFFCCFLLAGIAVRTEGAEILRKGCAIIWLIPFIGTCALAINETFGAPWALSGDPQSADTVIYFSPSDSDSLKLIRAAEGSFSTVFVPVMEKEGDSARIAGIQRAMRGGSRLSMAIETQVTGEPSLLMLLRLLCNATHVARSGSRDLPYVENRNVPHIMSYGAGAASSQKK